MKQLQKKILTLKQFDPEAIAMQIKPELDNLEYKRKKRIAIERKSKEFNEEIADLRLRLLPSEEVDQRAERWNSAKQNAASILKFHLENGLDYKSIENELMGIVEESERGRRE